MPKMTPTLWFNYNAEEAVGFWTSLLPDSRVDDVILAPSDNPSMEKGAVLAITFTLAGQTYNGINGGPQFPRFCPLPSPATIRPRSTATGTRCWPVADSPRNAAG